MTTRVTVYCGSRKDVPASYLELAAEVGTQLAARGWSLTWGGSSVSMMGEVARAAREGGARTLGVIPKGLVGTELADDHADELVVVDTMRERKALMEAHGDAFLTLPGGFGTLDELFEALTLVQTKKVTKFPVVLFGRSYWQGLYDWIQNSVLAGGKVGEKDLALLHLTDDIDDAVRVVQEAHKAWDEAH